MGGFAGGDEAGYWDIEPISAAVSKNPRRAKPTVTHDETGYHLSAHPLAAHIISFIPFSCDIFTIEGYDNPASHPIYLAYQVLIDATNDPEIADFFTQHKVILAITDAADTSSQTAAFLHLIKEACNLILSTDELAKIGSTIAPDIPFFIYNCSSITVTDTGNFG